MALFDWMEHHFGGKASRLGPDLMALGAAGQSEDVYGQNLTNEGLGNMRGQAADYTKMIGAGGLPDSIRQQFRIARGGIADASTRNQRDYSARLKQRFLTSGGQLSAAAQTEYDLQNQQQQGEGAFTATNALNAGEANLALQNTNALYDRLDNINKTITGVGQSEKDRALQRILQALQLRFGRNQAIAGSVTGIAGTVVAGQSKGGGSTGLTSGGGG